MKISLGREIKDGFLEIPLTTEKGSQLLRLPMDYEHPVIGPRMTRQLTDPVVFRTLLENPDESLSDWMGPKINLMYRNRFASVSGYGAATRDEIILRVKKKVLQHEAELAKLRNDVAILEVTAPTKRDV